MRCFIGIDLGSTTTKAVVIDENQNILGRGITNSRSNYDTAATIAKQEALLNGRFYLFRQALGSTKALNGALDGFIGQLERDFRLEQYLEQLGDLEQTCHRSLATAKFGDSAKAVEGALNEVFRRLQGEAADLFKPGAKRKSDFFRDIAGSQYLSIGETVAKEAGTRYDFLLNVFDRSIIEVENRVYADSIRRHLLAALERTFVALPETAAFDYFGNDVPTTDSRAYYCTQVRLTALIPNQLIRAEVRVWWYRQGGVRPMTYTDCARSATAAVSTDTTNIRSIYVSQTIQRHDS